MWDKPEDRPGARRLTLLSHDMPCPRCGHALHTFLACGDDCACPPARMPGREAA